MTNTILPRLLDLQHSLGQRPLPFHSHARISLAFLTKDRTAMMQQSFESIIQCSGFDLLWIDGSDNLPTPAVALSSMSRFPCIIGVDLNVKGGPSTAIQFALAKQLALGYDYVGLIESDVLLQPGWFPTLISLFDLGYRDGIAVGAVSVRGYLDRCLELRHGYSIDWACGAGMILFTRLAATLILRDYGNLISDTHTLRTHINSLFGVRLEVPEWDHRCPPTHTLRTSGDFSYSRLLYDNGLATLGSIPSLASDLDHYPELEHTRRVGADLDEGGLVHPLQAIPANNP